MVNKREINKVIGKAQTIFFPKLEDEVPIEAEQRILFHYRVLPEYEDNEEAVELLYNAIVKRALELRTEVHGGRTCKLCVSCTPNEHYYIQQALEKGYKETSGCYCMSAKKEAKIPILEYEIPGIEIRDISKELHELREQIMYNERHCFGDDASNWKVYKDCISTDYCLTYGAFDFGKLIGSVVADQRDGNVPEIESMMVLKEYRGKGIAKLMMSKVIHNLKERDTDEILLSVKNDNVPAIKLYTDMGFKVYQNKKMYMKYI